MAKAPLELNCVVTQMIQISPVNVIIRVVPDDWELPDFKPGQFAVLYLPGSTSRCENSVAEENPSDPDKMIRRAYSIASSSKTKEYIEFYITLVHSGALTPRIFALKVGDKIGLTSKFTGMFTVDKAPKEANIVLVATGTGVAPYISMLRSNILSDTNRKFAVIHGAYNSWDLGYSSELTLLESIAPNFKYLPTISHPQNEPAAWHGNVGFVQKIWQTDALEKAWGEKPTPENTHVFLCGNPYMIDEMVAILENEKFVEHKPKVEGQIHVERW
ncbi:MAG: ferredoxin--NADP reductase [Melioribacteraceae bacterium]|nr:ferredoxin--NADP reductase [Melioribacteraceae bacterium]